jgi:GNAT superfamily N-acetyltransferase
MPTTRSKPAIDLRKMTARDLAQAHGLSRRMHWPHRLEDWQFLFRFAKGVVAVADGAVVGTTLAWPYGRTAASVGLVIVAPECQGAGVGRRLMSALIDQMGNRVLTLNATDVALPLYKSLGFVPVGRLHQHQGAAFSVPATGLGRGERVRPMGSGDEEEILRLDRQATGRSREKLLLAVLAQARGVMLDRQGEAVGFALFRRFGIGYAIGPVAAEKITGAKAMISHWLGSNAGVFTRLDVPDSSALSPWLEGLGVPEVGSVTMMIRGEAKERDDRTLPFAFLTQATG